MATCERTKDSDELTSVEPQPLHLNMYIHQESFLAKCLLSACIQLQSRIQSKDTTTQAPGSSRLLVASWVTQIVLGVLSGVLGGFLYICKFNLLSSGTAVWTGAVSVLAGAAAFLQEKCGGRWWHFLRTLLALAAFSTAVAAVKIGADGFYWVFLYSGDYICDTSSTQRGSTAPPSTLSPEEDRRVHMCFTYVVMVVTLLRSLQAMLLGIWVLLLVASLTPLIPLASVCFCCCGRPLPEEEKIKRDLLKVECSPASG